VDISHGMPATVADSPPRLSRSLAAQVASGGVRVARASGVYWATRDPPLWRVPEPAFGVSSCHNVTFIPRRFAISSSVREQIGLLSHGQLSSRAHRSTPGARPERRTHTFDATHGQSLDLAHYHRGMRITGCGRV
jgi:hypothetical protein